MGLYRRMEYRNNGVPIMFYLFRLHLFILQTSNQMGQIQNPEKKDRFKA